MARGFHLSLIIIGHLLSLPGLGQQLFMQHYPAELYKGATQNWEVIQDNDGILYFANNDGVLSFDGRDWNLIPMPNKEFVFSVALSRDDKLYVASYNELGYFTRERKGNYTYHSLLLKLPLEYRDFKYMNEIAMQGDSVLFLDRDHLYVYYKGEFNVTSEAGKSFHLKNTLFLARKDGLFRITQSGVVASPYNDELRKVAIRWIGEGERGLVWILDEKNVLYEFDPAAAEGARLKLKNNLLSNYLKDIPRFRMLALDNGNLAVLSANELVIFDKDLQKVFTIGKGGIGENFTTRLLYEDKHHNLWLTTNASIVQVITSSPLGYYDKHNGLNGVVLSLGKKDSFQYAGTNTGIYVKEGETFGLVEDTGGEAWNFYNFHNKLYAAHGTGVFELEGKEAKKIIDQRYVHALCSLNGEANRMIMGTYNSGIWLMEKEKTGWRKKKIAGFEEETRFIQQDDDGSVWISHYNKGVYKIKLNSSVDSVVSTTFYDKSDGLPSNINNRIHRLRNGNIVVTTTNGIYQYNKGSDRFTPLTEINSALGDGFCVYTMAEGEEGVLYFWGGFANEKECAGQLTKTSNGTYSLQTTPFLKSAVAIRDLRVDVDAPVLYVGPNEIWIGNNVKVISYNPHQKTFYDDNFNTHLTKVFANDSSVLNITNNLPYSHNSLRVGFVASFFESPEKTQYQYTLKGFSNNWSDWSTSNEAVYTNLSDGDYTFSVRARNLYGKVSEPAEYSFYIHPPWYNTWWSYAIYAVCAMAFVGLMVQLNTSRIRGQKLKLERKVRKKTKKLRARNREIIEKGKEIEKQARELEGLNLTKDKLFSIVSHDLRGPIKQIQVILNLIESGHITEDEFKSFLPKFKESIEHTVNLTDNLLYWANSQMDGIQVKPSVFNLSSLASEHEHLFRPIASEKGISIINEIKNDIEVFADKDMIKLVLRNLINNSIKFTGKNGRIVLSAEPNHKDVIVSIMDTGVGIDEEQLGLLFTRQHLSRQGTFGEKGIGLGLMLCQEFIEKNKGSIGVESEKGKGSRFFFTIPYN